MNTAELETLTTNFHAKLDYVTLLTEMKMHVNKDWFADASKSLSSGLDSLEMTLVLMRKEVSKQKELARTAEEVKKVISNQLNQMRYALENLPARLPKYSSSQLHNIDSTKSSDEFVQIGNDKSNYEVGSGFSKQSGLTKESWKNGKPAKHFLPKIDYIVVDEFEAIPKYMKGRISYNQINSAVDELNKAFSAKYKILTSKKSTLSEKNKHKYAAFKLQETSNTKGINFIVDDDIKEFSSFRLDKTARAILMILRHCGRIREIRSNKLTRYALTHVQGKVLTYLVNEPLLQGLFRISDGQLFQERLKSVALKNQTTNAGQLVEMFDDA